MFEWIKETVIAYSTGLLFLFGVIIILPIFYFVIIYAVKWIFISLKYIIHFIYEKRILIKKIFYGICIITLVLLFLYMEFEHEINDIFYQLRDKFLN
jgi:hypothetical protein